MLPSLCYHTLFKTASEIRRLSHYFSCIGLCEKSHVYLNESNRIVMTQHPADMRKALCKTFHKAFLMHKANQTLKQVLNSSINLKIIYQRTLHSKNLPVIGIVLYNKGDIFFEKTSRRFKEQYLHIFESMFLIFQ